MSNASRIRNCFAAVFTVSLIWSFVTSSALAAEAPEVQTNPTHGYVSDTTARLLGTVNPKGSQVLSCEFEYGTSESYGHSVPCDTYPEAPEAGTTPYTVGAEVKGLEPETTYHFRLLADNGTGGPLAGTDRTLTTAPEPAPQAPCANPPGVPHPANLPPCWAYELVTPAQTTGNQEGGAFIAPDGERAFLTTFMPLLPDQATGNNDMIEMTRTTGGWVPRDLGLEPDRPSTESFVQGALSSDGTRVIGWRCSALFIGCKAGNIERFIRVEPDGSRTAILEAEIVFGVVPPAFVGAAEDLSRAIFTVSAQTPLLPEDTHAFGRGLYASEDGRLEFLGYDQNGDVLECGAAIGGTGNNPLVIGFEQNGTSADGRTVTFESPEYADSQCSGTPPVDIYIRRNGQSTNISAPRPGDPGFGGSNPDEGAQYVGSDRGGDVAYFITKTKLAASDTNAAPDLYRYDLASDTLALITSGADVRAAVVSPGGDYVYLKATQQIGGEGVAGGPNLFVYHAGSTKLIATAPGLDFGIGGTASSAQLSLLTPDGRTLLFTASAQLTGQPTGGNTVGGQLFRYSLPEQSLSCLTCMPDGSVPSSGFQLGKQGPPANSDARTQSDDGSTVAFATAAPLLAEDTNGVEDVYMWREGRLYLISSGHSEATSSLVGLDLTGTKVFLKSAERLVGGLANDALRTYTARLNGGFSSPPTPTPCEGGGCRGASSAPAAIPGPATPGFSGPGNPGPRRPKPKKHKHRKHAHKRAASHKHGGRR